MPSSPRTRHSERIARILEGVADLTADEDVRLVLLNDAIIAKAGSKASAGPIGPVGLT